MSANLERAIVAAVAETLENMTFMEAAPAQSGAEGETLTAGLLIHAPFPAELRLTLPLTLLGKVAESVFALPAEELEAQVLRDLLAEILNTVAGRLLTAYLPPEQSYQLGLPEFGDEGVLPDTEEKSWFFQMEGEPFTLRVRGEALLRS
jgi:hypothetical protein